MQIVLHSTHSLSSTLNDMARCNSLDHAGFMCVVVGGAFCQSTGTERVMLQGGGGELWLQTKVAGWFNPTIS